METKRNCLGKKTVESVTNQKKKNLSSPLDLTWEIYESALDETLLQKQEYQQPHKKKIYLHTQEQKRNMQNKKKKKREG